jgi:hypothetical protein
MASRPMDWMSQMLFAGASGNACAENLVHNCDHTWALLMCVTGSYTDAPVTLNTSAPCTPCPTGQTTADTGATSSSQCFGESFGQRSSCS